MPIFQMYLALTSNPMITRKNNLNKQRVNNVMAPVQLNELEQQLKTSGAIVWHAGHQVAEQWIEDAEKSLSLKLPHSYKWWLRQFGDGMIDGSHIFTLAPPQFREDADCDLVYMHELNMTHGVADADKLYIFQPDTDECYYFDLTAYNQDTLEYPVMREDLAQETVDRFAESFAQFLQKQMAIFKSS
ncbi:hypothetical protein EBB07_24925 [Paenibacillaceae bacterium]|nr:hypothetical protein EBB07_24925 [Paenibacillaceae bacterium]